MLPTTEATAKALYWQKQAEKTVGLVAAFETYYYNNQLQVGTLKLGEEAISLVASQDPSSFHLLHTFTNEEQAQKAHAELWKTANPSLSKTRNFI